MYNEISMTVRSQTKASRYLLIGLIGTALMLIGIAFVFIEYSRYAWVLALCFIMMSIYVYNRYVGSEYTYMISVDSGSPTFTVNMRVGKTIKTLARIDVYSINEVRCLSGRDLRRFKSKRGVTKYPYYPTINPDRVYLISTRSADESADLIIEVSDEFAKELKRMSGC